jgi:hypothetical protein
MTMGRQHPQEKVSAAVALPLDPVFFTVPFFFVCFLVLAIVQPSFAWFLRLLTASM